MAHLHVARMLNCPHGLHVACTVNCSHGLPVRVQVPLTTPNKRIASKPGVTSRSKPPSLTVVAYDAHRRRLYYGLDNGETAFWVVDGSGAGTSR